MAEKLLSNVPPGATILADKGYAADLIRGFAKRRGAWGNILMKANRKKTFSFNSWSNANAITWSVSLIASSRCAALPHE
jgi:hypothetical protein